MKPFRAVETARVRYLSEAECVRLVNACEPAFRNLVRGALLTGCRYSELTAMHVADFNADAGVVTVRESKAGKPRHVVLTDEGQRLFATLTAGKLGTRSDFRRVHDGGVWGKSHQLRPMLEACARAKIKPAVSFHVLRHTHGSTLAMRGVPMGVIAEQLGHADTRMTEKHYAHLAPSYVADTIRAHFPTLGIAGETTVTAIDPPRRNRWHDDDGAALNVNLFLRRWLAVVQWAIEQKSASARSTINPAGKQADKRRSRCRRH